MIEKKCDILIVGSGLTGIVAAYALSLLNFEVIIVDQKKIFSSNSSKNISFKKDTRTTAVSEGSKDFLKEVKIWNKLSSFSEPIKEIKVIDRKPSRTIEFCNKNTKKNLGYIIKNNIFIKTLIKNLKTRKNVKIFEEAKLKNIKYSSNKIICNFNNFLIIADLLIAADGKNSTIRNEKKTGLYKKTYKENAIVINFEHSKHHNNCAYEFFYNNGPLAILPMQKEKNNQSSLIWSNDKIYLQSLYDADIETFKKIIEEKISSVVGKITNIKSKQIFPLSAHINYKFYEKKLVYIGDAAHSIHPIAGQGWNLGLRDIRNLYHLIKDYKNMGLEIGSNHFCKTYNEKCFYDSYRLYQITDKLNYIFVSDNKIFNIMRAIGFDYIQNKGKLKNIITDFAMGY